MSLEEVRGVHLFKFRIKCQACCDLRRAGAVTGCTSYKYFPLLTSCSFYALP